MLPRGDNASKGGDRQKAEGSPDHDDIEPDESHEELDDFQLSLKAQQEEEQNSSEGMFVHF